MTKRIMAMILMLTVLFSLTGCTTSKGTKEKTQKKMGRYVEQQVQTPEFGPNEQNIGVLCDESGQLEYYTYEYGSDVGTYNVYCYQLINNTYEKKKLDWASNAARANECDPIEILVGEDGKHYMLDQSFEILDEGTEEQSYLIQYHLIQQGEGSEEYIDMTPESWKYKPKEDTNEGGSQKGSIVNSIQISKNGVLCYQSDYQDDMYFYDLSKKKELNLSDIKTEQQYTVYENKLYYIPEGVSTVNCYDLETQQEESSPVQMIKSKSNIQVASNGDIYLADCEGIHHYKKGGTMWETIVDGSICSMSIPSYEITSFIVTKGELDSFYIWYTSLIEDNKKLFAKYSYDETVASTFEKELTVYSLWDNVSLREAIFDYMKKHPDTKIKYVVAASDDSAATVSDLIRELNTELLAGKGADILLLDGLPMDSYIQKGVLLDTTDIFSELVENNTLVKNIAQNYVKDGKVYGMPMRFFVPMYAFSKDINKEAASVSSLAELSQNSDKKLFSVLPYDTLLTMFLYTYSDELKGADGLIDPATLKEFLSNIKTIADQTDAVPENQGDYGMAISSEMGYNQRIQKILCGNASELVISDIYATMGYVSDMTDWKIYEACAQELNGVYQSVNDTFIPNGIVGINKAAKDTELARDFVKSLYEEDLQEKHMNDGFPMNATVLEQWMKEKEDDDSSFTLGISDEKGKTHMIKSGPLSDEVKKRIYDMLLSLSKPVNNDTTVQDMIVEGGMSYLRGEKPLDQVVQEITDKLNLYLNE